MASALAGISTSSITDVGRFPAQHPRFYNSSAIIPSSSVSAVVRISKAYEPLATYHRKLDGPLIRPRSSYVIVERVGLPAEHGETLLAI
jgi:hypothetical protein